MKHSRLATAFGIAALAAGGIVLAEGAYPPSGSYGNTGPGTTSTPPPGAMPSGNSMPGSTAGTTTQSVDTTPLVIVVPTYFAMDPNLANGCWARFFDKKDFGGAVFTAVGPVNIPHNRAGYITGFEAGRNYDSLQVGSRANLTVWEGENYQKRSTTFPPGQAVPNLDSRMSGQEDIKSMKLTCAQ